METFTIKQLCFTYPLRAAPALDHITLSIEKGQFVTICGKSGSGKTTLLRQLKSVLSPHGEKSGEILFEGTPLTQLDPLIQAEKIGFVMQSPENQVVTDKVWHELAFGLESLGYDNETIRLRVAEMASFFGIEGWFYQDVSALSGGQRQLLNLASVMAMQPSVLILDEPTSQLDPIAASDFLATVHKLNRELGVTVLMTEHRLEEALPLSDRLIVMDEGKVIADGTPKDVGQQLKAQKHSMFFAMPTPMRVYSAVESDLDCPITVREGRNWLDALSKTITLNDIPPPPAKAEAEGAAIELHEVWFRYEKDAPDIISGLSLTVDEGEFFCLLGGNGTGKTTALSLISGISTPQRGTVSIDGRPLDQLKKGGTLFSGLLGVLPQNPQALFIKKTVEADLFEMLSEHKESKEQKAEKVASVARLCRLGGLLNAHPYDLSGGEQQRAALAKVLLLQPRILLLDEPTKGMDAHFKEEFFSILKRLQAGGATILMVSHDIEFCARYADRCALFFDGKIVTQGRPQSFFTGNSFYTTAANRMARHLLPSAVTAEDVIYACGGGSQKTPFTPMDILPKAAKPAEAAPKPPKISGRRKALGAVLILLSLLLLCLSASWIPELTPGELPYALPDHSGWLYAGAAVCVAAGLWGGCQLLFKRSSRQPPPLSAQAPKEQRKLSRRTLFACVSVLLLIPLTILVGIYYFGDRKYYFISLLVVLEAMLPFILVFEGRKPQARELVVIAVLCGLAVAGRAAFFWLPQFKPVLALVIISGVAFGGEAGFLVGAVTGLISNFFFGQGPWTPWQMFAFGLIGFLAGVFFRKGVLRRSRVALSIFGGVSALLLYGGIMNVSAAFLAYGDPAPAQFAVTFLLGLPFDVVHAVATAFFLMLAANPMLEKLDRIKIKYGLIH